MPKDLPRHSRGEVFSYLDGHCFGVVVAKHVFVVVAGYFIDTLYRHQMPAQINMNWETLICKLVLQLSLFL